MFFALVILVVASAAIVIAEDVPRNIARWFRDRRQLREARKNEEIRKEES